MDIEIFGMRLWIVNEARGAPKRIDNEFPDYTSPSALATRNPKLIEPMSGIQIIATVQERTRKRDKSLGVVTWTVGELMDAQEGCEEVSILFDLVDLKASIHLTLSLRLKSDSQRTTERLLCKTQMDVDRLAPPSFLKHDLPDPSSLEDSVWIDFLNVFEKFSAVASVVVGLASAHRSRSQRDQRVVSLLRTMTNVYGFVEMVDAHSSISELSDLVNNIVGETVRCASCATLFGEYPSRGFPSVSFTTLVPQFLTLWTKACSLRDILKPGRRNSRLGESHSEM
ncbi:hypothetical protein SISNIDRAFT_467671 [Sistotremastrum niveocremeum HHB9708]|uniref:Uncharacterized protein n=1 Tax=Sistotremastrum niveocremeum HHB9708 TaxID=1314777 RepID=A0A164SF58_9AGAM|nr:hypothetical protein SISNIDRAFT_467671 [Sistotremastrum niveocremeum HHB9708]